MPGIILSVPGNTGTPPTPAVPNLWTPMSHRWDAWDGTSWDLSSRRSGVFLLAGVRGLHFPPINRYTSASPAVAGSRWRGYRTEEREVFWPVKVWNDQSSQDWIDYDSAWHRTLRPDQLGTWVVTQPNGRYRTLQLRFVDDGNHSIDTDPGRAGWDRYALTFAAEDPYWKGEPIERRWEASDPVDFFDPSGSPVFHISSGHALDNATISNPGDVDAWGTWTIHGPTTSVSVGLGAGVVEVPFAVADGDWVTIDTDPSVQTAITNEGVDRTADLGEVGFAPIPAGASVPLELAMTGAGAVELQIVPRYWRAW